jgi:hypothetical protein
MLNGILTGKSEFLWRETSGIRQTMDFYLNISKTIIFPSLRLKTLIFVVVWHECIMGKILFIIIFRI